MNLTTSGRIFNALTRHILEGTCLITSCVREKEDFRKRTSRQLSNMVVVTCWSEAAPLLQVRQGVLV